MKQSQWKLVSTPKEKKKDVNESKIEKKINGGKMDEITLATLASGPGAWLVTTGILMTLKAQLGEYWTDLANRITGLVLPIVFVEAAVFATGTTHWVAYFLAFLTGLLASQGTFKAQTGYDNVLMKKAK